MPYKLVKSKFIAVDFSQRIIVVKFLALAQSIAINGRLIVWIKPTAINNLFFF
jgi:hypothetical protein